ncbi:MAG: LptF/LptG family permease [bacterium]
MWILEFYILRTFWKPFVTSLFFFSGLIIITRFFTQSALLIETQLPPLIFTEYFLCQIPFALVLVSPVAVLLACLFSLGSLAHHNEIMAMKSSGVHSYRIILPILLSALFISFLITGFNNSIVLKANQRVSKIKSQKIYRENISFIVENLSFRNDKGWFLMIKSFDKEKGKMEGIEIKALNDEGHLSLRIDAKEAKWVNGIWWLKKGILRGFNQQGLVIKEEKFEEQMLQMWSPKEIWLISQAERKQTNDMSIKELVAYIELLKESGCKFNDKLVDLHLKISFPFANLIMALIGTSLSLQKPKGKIVASFGLSILISFLYWEAIGIGRALGMAENLPPVFSAWIANIIFGIVGIYLAFKIKN